MWNMEIFHCLPDLFQMPECLLRAVPKKKRDELLAAIAGKKVCLTLQMGSCCLGYGRNYFIAGRMAEYIIVYFEAINVKHADRERSVQPDSFLPLGNTVLLIPAAIGNPCQLIGHGLLFNLLTVLIQLNMCVDSRLDNHGIKWLCNIVNSSQDEPALLIGCIGKAGNQNDRDILGDDLFLQFFLTV